MISPDPADPKIPPPNPPEDPARSPASRDASVPPAEQDLCPICGTPLFSLHCKRLRRNCGYREDCSDLF